VKVHFVKVNATDISQPIMNIRLCPKWDLLFLTCSIIFSLEANQNYRFPATGLPVEVKCTVAVAKLKEIL